MSFHITMSDSDLALMPVDPRHFRFNEIHSAAPHCAAQVERNVVPFTFTKGRPHLCGIKDKKPATRHQRNLMLVTQLFSKLFRSDNAAESTAKNQNLRHLPNLSALKQKILPNEPRAWDGALPRPKSSSSK